MIPVRLELRGCLTYRDAQVLDFDGIRTGVIIGDNGHGKSAIFDAITFALFGAHRGGKSGAVHLINQESNELVVALDFDLEGRRYRIHRSLARGPRKNSRTVSSAQAWEWDGAAWLGIPEADSSDGCKRWAETTLGLTYETCCASILLRQGAQDDFLNCTPTKRQEVMNALLDLEPYRNLQRAVQQRHRSASDQARVLTGRLQGLAPHDAELLKALASSLDKVRDECLLLQRERDTARDRRERSRRYEELIGKRNSLDQRLAEKQALLSNVERIRADARRYRILEGVVPLLQSALDADRKSREAEEEAADAQRQAGAIDLEGHRQVVSELGAQARQAKEKSDATAAKAEALNDERRALRPKGEALVFADAAAEEAQEHRRRAGDLSGKAAEYAAAAAEAKRLEALGRERPWLTQLASARSDLKDAIGRERVAAKECREHTRSLQATVAAIPAARKELAEAHRHCADLERQHAAAEAELRQLRETLAQRREAGAEQTCSRCGAPIDATKVADEIAHTQGRIERLEGEAAGLADQLGDMRSWEEQCEVALSEAQEGERRARAALERAQREQERASHDRSLAGQRIETVVSNLSDEAAARATAEASYPGEEDLATLDAEIARLPRATQRANAAREAAEARQRSLTLAQTWEEKALRHAGEVPVSEHDTVRERWVRINDEIDAVDRRRAQAQRAWEEAAGRERVEYEKLSKAERTFAQLSERAQARTEAAEQHRAQRDDLLLKVPQEHRPARVDAVTVEELVQEQARLTSAAQQASELDGIEQEVRDLERWRAETEAQIGAIPKDDRRPVADADRDLQGLEQNLGEAEDRLRAEQLRWSTAEQAARKAHELERELKQAQVDEADLRLLERLLGVRELQGKLVEDATIGIADAANCELEAISNGTLRLEMQRRLRGDGEEAELDLLVFDSTSGSHPMEAAFLSGSQRFRVAVALALGIGQYAGGAARRQRAVIIDEGFGSLDAEGLETMTEHLRDLGGRLDRVILVTHQNEMRRRFSDGFYVEKRERASRVSRLDGVSPKRLTDRHALA